MLGNIADTRQREAVAALQSALPSADKALTIFPIYFVSFAQQ